MLCGFSKVNTYCLQSKCEFTSKSRRKTQKMDHQYFLPVLGLSTANSFASISTFVKCGSFLNWRWHCSNLSDILPELKHFSISVRWSSVSGLISSRKILLVEQEVSVSSFDVLGSNIVEDDNSSGGTLTWIPLGTISSKFFAWLKRKKDNYGIKV